jgi:hypothetical protein
MTTDCADAVGKRKILCAGVDYGEWSGESPALGKLVLAFGR